MSYHPITLLCWEAAFAMAYETWLGSSYLSAVAGKLKLPFHLVVFLMALPWIGSLGQLIGLKLLNNISSLKKYTLTMALIARGIWTLPLTLAYIWGEQAIKTSTAFPYEQWFILIIFTATLSSIFASTSTVAWMSWMRNLISTRFQGRFLSIRHQFIMGTLIMTNLLASFIIDWKYQSLNAGFLMVGFLGLIAGLTSTSILFRVHDLKNSNWKPSTQTLSIRLLFKNRGFNRVLIFSSAFHCAIFTAAPYFPYYFTHELNLSMGTVTFWIALSSLGNFLAAGFWGKKIDRAHSLTSIIRGCALKLSFSPLLYLILDARTILWVAPLEYFMNGMAWSGFILALTTTLFRHCPKSHSPQYFSLYSASIGLSSAIGILLGGSLVHLFHDSFGFSALWITAGALRFGTAILLIGLLKNQDIRIPAFSRVRKPAWLSTQLAKQAKASSVEEKDSGISAAP